MARWTPPPNEGNNPFFHPAFSLALVVACIAAIVAVISSLCASCHPKPSAPSPKSPLTEKPASSFREQEQEQEQEQDGTDTTPTQEEGITELEAAIHGPIYPTMNLPAGSTSKRRLSVSVSINGVKEGLSRIRTKKEKIGIRGGGEESLWKKTIILGEKCRMQNEEEGEDGGQPNRADGREQSDRADGGEQSSRVDDDTATTPRSKQVSRNASFAEREARHA